MEIHAFTTSYDRISNKLISSATLVSGDKKYKTELAQWDTGASQTCISENIVQQLGLIPCGQKPMQTPSGQKIVNEYRIDVILPNENVYLSNVYVIDSEIGEQGIDMLIGMNIINLGDFAVSNFNNKTVFTFRIPSEATTDYVKVIDSRNHIKNAIKVYPNDPCPCGSGKKYKKCCGRKL